MTERRQCPSPEETRAVIDALELMMKLRSQVPYRGRGFLLLNAACCRLSKRFWSEAKFAPANQGRTMAHRCSQ